MESGLRPALDALTLLPLLGSGSRRAVGWSTVGAFLIILGAASALPDWDTLASAPDSFLAVSAGFIWVGLGCVGFGAWAASRKGEVLSLARWGPVGTNIGITIAAAICIGMIYRAGPLLVAGSWRGLVAAAGLAATGVVVGIALRESRVASVWRWLDQRWLARPQVAGPVLGTRGRRIWQGLAALGMLVLLFSGQLFVAVAAALLLVVAVYPLAREAGKAPRFPVQAVIVAAGLLLYLWLVATVAGSEIPLSFPGILDAPLSESAEALLALFLGLAAWGLLGLWPFHGAGPGSVLALAAGALLLRWGMGFIPAGMVHAAPLFAIVAVIAALHAASTGRVGEYAASIGALAVTTGQGGTWVLFALASLVASMRMMDYHPPVPGLDRRQLAGVVMIPAFAAVLPMALRMGSGFTAIAVLASVALFRPTTE